VLLEWQVGDLTALAMAGLSKCANLKPWQGFSIHANWMPWQEGSVYLLIRNLSDIQESSDPF